MKTAFPGTIRLWMAALLILAGFALPSRSVHASSGAIFLVNSVADNEIDDGLCTLREALHAANGNSNSYMGCTNESGVFGDDLISFSLPANSVITLNSSLPAIALGSTIIDGRNKGSPVTIDGAGSHQIFYVNHGTKLQLENIIIQNGNSGSDVGGAIITVGELIVTKSAFLNNTTTADGGAISINNGMATIVNSTFSGNSATYGGAVSNNSGTLTIYNSTISGNTATTQGGALTTWQGGVMPPVTTIYNTIMANSAAPEDCWNGFGAGTLSGSNNLIETTAEEASSCNAITVSTSDPQLGALTGAPPYFPLNPGSPAIDAGTNTNCPATDQRGFARPNGAFCDIGAFERIVVAAFADVPLNSFAWAQIESVYNAGITGGCTTSPLNYCPNNSVTRSQMAIFLLRGKYGSAFSPPAPTGGVFGDVPSHAFAAAWIEQLATEGITGGCGGGNYCPNNTVTRSQMAIFLLRAKYGSSYTPPPATGGQFLDVPSGAFAAAWIEQLVAEGITGGCGGGNYCPNNPVTRSQMAIFLQRTFNLPLP